MASTDEIRTEARKLIRSVANNPTILGQDPEDTKETTEFFVSMEDGIIDMLLARPEYPENPSTAVAEVLAVLKGETVEYLQTVALLDRKNEIVLVEEGYQDILEAHYFASSLVGVPVMDIEMHQDISEGALVEHVAGSTIISGYSIHITDPSTGATVATMTSYGQSE